MKPYLLTFIIIGLFSTTSQAQDATQEIAPIATDRPDQTETPFLVPKGMFQVETGISYEEHEAGSSVVPTALYKYGLNENFEFRLITEFESSKMADERTSGLTPILVGFKSKIADEKGFWPKTSVIAHMSIPEFAADDYQADFYAPEFRFVMQHALSPIMSLSYNLGAEWDGFSAEPTFIYTLSAGFSVTDKMGSFIEFYGFAPQENKSDHRFDGGLTYLLSNNAMIDLSGGVGLTENAPDFFVAMGFSFRI